MKFLLFVFNVLPVTQQRVHDHQTVLKHCYYLSCILTFKQQFSSGLEGRKLKIHDCPISNNLFQFGFDVFFLHSTYAYVLNAEVGI